MEKDVFVAMFKKEVLGVMDDLVRDFLNSSGYGWLEGDGVIYAIEDHAAAVYEREFENDEA